MATKIREEGDYTFWDDGAQRYSKGNSLGKAPGSLAKRHPKAATTFDKLTVSKRRDIASSGGTAKYEARRIAVSDAYAFALRDSHPDIRSEEKGLRELAKANYTQANQDDGSAAVRARAQFIEQYAGKPKDDRVVSATQVNITLSPGVGTDLSRFAQLPHVIDITEEEEDDDSE